MSDLIKTLKDNIEFAKENECDMNAVSWGYQEGCLISYNEAKDIVKLFESAKEVIRISDRKHIAWDNLKIAMKNVSFDYTINEPK